MYESTPVPIGHPWSWLSGARSALLLCAALAGACGGSSGGGGQSGIPGTEAVKPTGGFFFVDPNQSGGAANLHLASVAWGRLVDIHEIDASGERVADPVYRDFVIEQGVLTNGTSYVLDRNPVTQRERLTIQARKRGLGVDSSAFDDLLAAASDALPVVSAKNDDGSSSPPFAVVPRNACAVLRFDDCLNDGTTAQANLNNTVNVLTGYPPATPFSARVLFDPNHGAVLAGDFHSTRVLVDMTTSQFEASTLPTTQVVNAVGLPASLTTTASANVSIRVPSQIDLGSGQSQVLSNLSGVTLDVNGNGPVDLDSPTLDVVRAFQSGNASNPNDSNGFLRDLERPRVIGSWPIQVSGATDDPAGVVGLDFLIDLFFSSTCLADPDEGDVVKVGDAFLEVREATVVGGNPVVGLKVRAVNPVPDAAALDGNGFFESPFEPTSPLATGCWVTFIPEATTFPTTAVSTTAQVLARFSEPMDPDSLSPFGSFLLVDGAASAVSTANANNIVVGQVLTNDDLNQFFFRPSLFMAHTQGAAEAKHVELTDARDLAGNKLSHKLPFVDFTLDPAEASQRNDSLVLRFNANDEYGPNGPADGKIDLRGQFFYDTARGVVLPRPVSFSGWPVDRNNPVPSNMTALPAGLFTPLTPLGAKVQMLWRYVDTGWNVRDETKYNLDVVGLSWSPIGGLVVADFFEQFEIRLGHSRFLPDEDIVPTTGLPKFPTSGLPSAPSFFEDNFLAGSNPRVVHNRALGYTVNPANVFLSTSLTPMMPYPLNRGTAPDVTYTWRDTAILSLGADGSTTQPGIPLAVDLNAGAVIAGPGLVPSFGLPLLIEVRCFPADRGIGLNQFDVSLANAVTTTPNFRAYSAGGVNTAGQREIVLPDREDVPAGGFNPNSTPAGVRTKTNADNSFYLGQLDTVVRVSRIHTVWLDVGSGNLPLWLTPALEPATQPSGTEVLLDFRSATGFAGAGTTQFDASTFDVYGNQTNVPQTLSDWSSDIAIGNSKRFLQVRLTFVNNIETGLSPELDALAIPFELQ